MPGVVVLAKRYFCCQLEVLGLILVVAPFSFFFFFHLPFA
jgi:hypothetical protein